MPAIAKIQVPQLLADAGLQLTTKPDFDPYRKTIPRFHELSADERNRLIKRDPKYGHIVGRCQWGFCGPHVIQIFARELDISPTQVLGREAPALLVENKDLPKAIHTN